MADREKGVASVTCPTCDNELALTEQPDGSVAAETCASCYPQEAPTAEKASASSAPRERGTTVNSEEESNG